MIELFAKLGENSTAVVWRVVLRENYHFVASQNTRLIYTERIAFAPLSA